MSWTRTLQQCAAFLLFAALLHGEAFKDVKYLYKAEGQDEGQEVDGQLSIDPSAKTIVFGSYASGSKKHPAPTISLQFKSTSITSALYERSSRPRYIAALLIAWPLIFTKGKKHFLTIQYASDSGEGKYAIFHMDKGNYREILAAIEAATGKKVERSEEH
jgi:hypothetical protein